MTVLQLDGVSASYGAGAAAVPALAPTSLALAAGESVAVVGRSGAGKSTLADVVLGLRRPDGGQVLVEGQPWVSRHALPHRARRHLVQGVPQDPAAAFVPRWTLRQSIEAALRRFGGAADTAERLAWAAQLAHLDPDLLDRRPAEVSGGQAQRAAIARAVAVGPSAVDQRDSLKASSLSGLSARAQDLGVGRPTLEPELAPDGFEGLRGGLQLRIARPQHRGRGIAARQPRKGARHEEQARGATHSRQDPQQATSPHRGRTMWRGPRGRRSRRPPR